MPNLSLTHSGNMDITSAEITSAGTLSVSYGLNTTPRVTGLTFTASDDEFICGNTYTITATPITIGTILVENFTVSGVDLAGVERSDTCTIRQKYETSMLQLTYKMWALCDDEKGTISDRYLSSKYYSFDLTINTTDSFDVTVSWWDSETYYTDYRHYYAATYHINVSGGEPGPEVATSLTLNVASAITNSGQATATYSPPGATVNLVYSSSDDTIATINPDTGQITVLTSGTVQFCVTDTISNLSDCKYVDVYRDLETKIAITFDVTSTTKPVKILHNSGLTSVTKIEFENGTNVPVATGYTFSTTGLHTLYYTLQDPTTVPAFTFGSLPRISRIVIPDIVTTLGNGCFQGNVHIPNVVYSEEEPIQRELVIGTGITPSSFYWQNIPSTAFGNAGVYSSITLNRDYPGTGELFVSGNCLLNKTSTIEWEVIFGCNSSVIPANTWRLNSNCFTGLRQTSINIPNSVRYINDYVFQNTLLTGITIPENVGWVNCTMLNGSKDLRVITCLASPAPQTVGLRSWGLRRENNDGMFYYPCGTDYSSWLDDYDAQNPGLETLGWNAVCFQPNNP